MAQEVIEEEEIEISEQPVRVDNSSRYLFKEQGSITDSNAKLELYKMNSSLKSTKSVKAMTFASNSTINHQRKKSNLHEILNSNKKLGDSEKSSGAVSLDSLSEGFSRKKDNDSKGDDNNFDNGKSAGSVQKLQTSQNNFGSNLSFTGSENLDGYRAELVAKGKTVRVKGEWEYEKSFDSIRMEDIKEYGGRTEFCKLFTRFYEKLMADELLKKLFGDLQKKRKAKDFGVLYGMFILSKIQHDDKMYEDLPKKAGLAVAHNRAKHCPYRPKNYRGRGFTTTEVDLYLGYLCETLDELKVEPGLKNGILTAFGRNVKSLGPFILDKNEQNEVGEQLLV